MEPPLCLHPGGPSWPEEISRVRPAPERLWIRGRAELLRVRPRVAIVGSRAATPYGLAQARRFGRELARAGVLVVSGMARGVDAEAHLGALDAGGATLAVLGSGVDLPWPPGPLAERMAREGLLLSEFEPGVGPRRHHFPLRNRLISCLSAGVLVIEAAGRSGSLITARWGLDQGRAVYALPGRVDHPLAEGILGLLKAGATPVGSPADLLEDLFGWVAPARRGEALPAPSPLLAALEGETLTVDELARATKTAVGDTLAQLLELELAGRVVRAPGGLYRLPT